MQKVSYRFFTDVCLDLEVVGYKGRMHTLKVNYRI